MHRIYRPWAAGRESQLFALPSPPHHHHCPSFLHRHVSVKRLSLSTRPGSLVPFPRRAFTNSCNAKLPSQAAQPNRENDTEYDDTAQRSPTHRTASVLNRKPGTAQPCSTSDGRLVENSLDGQTSPDESPLSVPHDRGGTALLGDDRRIPVHEEDFAPSNGFWPSQTSDPSLTTFTLDISSPKIGSTQPACSEQSEQHLLPLSATESVLEQLWTAQPRHGKVDLSYWDPVRGELEDTYSTQPKLGRDSHSARFRTTTHSRRLVAEFVGLIYPHISPTIDISDSAALPLFTHPFFTPVGMDVGVILRVLSWSWILVAPPALRLKRLIHWSRSKKGHITPDVPQWLVLQLLRSERIDPGDLVDLLSLIDQKLTLRDLKGSIMTLVVRLLRHARLSNPTCFGGVVKLFVRLLDQCFPSQPPLEDARRRAHWCNRVLTLLALPVRSHPFKHVIVQQDAQLLLLHYMYDVSPVIPLSREGYRALADLQLMHAKTDIEKKWTKIQAVTWPPWEQQHQMGVTSPPRESPGSMSRINLVLHRMKEDGYSLHAYDLALQILGGRDSDGSPTVQVRRPPATIPSRTSWLPGPDNKQIHTLNQVWIARITATRTVREAWMGLCAYKNLSTDTTYAASVYHAMFKKLWAETVAVRSNSGPLPGDGLENFAEPELVRDRVHVPEEPPSVPELYARMLANGTKPSGRLLLDLLARESDLYTGLAYIKDSPLHPSIKAILTRVTTRSPADVAKALNKLHKDTRQAYISLLARPHAVNTQPPPKFSSDGSDTCLSGPAFTFQVLQHAKLTESSVWGEYFSALSKHRHPALKDRWRIGLNTAWRLMCDTCALETRSLDCTVLPHVLSTARNVETGAVWIPEKMPYEPLGMSMNFFMEAVSGVRQMQTQEVHERWTRFMRKVRPSLHSVPAADTVQDMALVIVMAQRQRMSQDILDLLHWACEHRQHIEVVSTFTKRNLAAFRVYLEGQWATLDLEFSTLGLEIMVADQYQMEKAKELCHYLGGWATDDDVGEYLHSSRSLFERLKKKLKREAQIA